MKVPFPIRHIEGNVIFSSDDSVWAYYRIPTRNYIYRSPGEKKQILNEWVRLFRKVESEMHILLVSRYLNLDEHEKRLKGDVPDGPLKKQGESYISQMMNVLRKNQNRPNDAQVFLGVKLAGTKRQKSLIYHVKDFFRYLHTSAGIEPYSILKEELEFARNREQLMFQDIRSCIFCERATAQDLQYLISHSAYRGIGEPRVNPGWNPSGAQMIQNLITGEYEVEAHHIRVRQFHEGAIRDGWMQFLYMASLPEDIRYPGEEWLHWVHSLPFPVDVSLRIRVVPNQEAVKLLERRKRRLQHSVQHTRVEGQNQDLVLEEAYRESVEEEARLKEGKDPILRLTAGFCVYASTKEELMRNTHHLISMYEKRNEDMKLIISPGDQFFAFHEFLPGGPIYVKDFTHWLYPEMVAGGAINATQFLGDGRGMFIGYTGPSNVPFRELNRPVFVHQALAAQGGERVETKSLAILVVGLTGFGKSYASSLLAYQAIHHLGARVLLFDVKGERSNWVDRLPGLKGHVSLIRLGSDPRYRGMFDPFHVFGMEDAKLYAKDFLVQLIQVERSHDWHHIIQQAINEVAEREAPSMRKVLMRIREKDERLYHSLALYQQFPFAQLVFGDEKPPNTFRLDQPLNIIQIDELTLPHRDKDPKQYNEREILSVALMLPLTGFANQVVKQDRRFKVVWWEEAWVPMSSDQGRRAIDEGIRMGRYWNSETLLVTQNPSDVPDQLINNIGMRFIFKTTVESEVTKALEILGLENTTANREAIKNLREGECFFRDIYGQVGRMYVNVLFRKLAEAFDTTPPLQKEGVAG